MLFWSILKSVTLCTPVTGNIWAQKNFTTSQHSNLTTNTRFDYLCRDNMIIHQFYDKGLAHASYAVIRLGKMVVIDPARDPQPYYAFAEFNNADIVGVIETHPHADFV